MVAADIRRICSRAANGLLPSCLPTPEESNPTPGPGSRHLPALEVEGCGTVVAAQQVSPLSAAVAGVVVGGPAAPPDVSHQLPTALLHLFGLWGRQQGLDLL